MTIEWTPEVEQRVHAVEYGHPGIDSAVTAVYDAIEKVCGNRHAHADMPLRFLVGAVLAHTDPRPSALEQLAQAALDGRVVLRPSWEGYGADAEVVGQRIVVEDDET